MPAHRLSRQKRESGPKAERRTSRVRRVLHRRPAARHSRQPMPEKRRAALRIILTVRGKTIVAKASHKATPKSRRPTTTERDAIIMLFVFSSWDCQITDNEI